MTTISKSLIFIACLIPSLLFANSNNLNQQQVAIEKYLATTQNDQLQLLEKLVNINSSTENIKGVIAVGDILKQQFNSLGFETRWEQPHTDIKHAPTLVAERKGKRGKRILLIGHLDTVFSQDNPFQKFKLSGSQAIGPGVIDIKGGDVIMLYALKALAANHALDDTSITVVLTGDEESSAKPVTIARAPLFQAAEHSDIALDFESSKTKDQLSIARRGISSWLIQATAAEGHSSLIFKDGYGYGANFELARILNDMRMALSGEKNLTFNPGIMLGGTKAEYDEANATGTTYGKTNVIAQLAITKGDLRYLTDAQKIAAKHTITEIVAKHLPGTKATVVFNDSMPPMPPTAASLKLLNQYSAISEALGYGNVTQFPPDLRGGGDISYIAAKVPAGLIGLGAIGAGEHSPKETLEIDSLVIQAQRAALLIYALTN